MNEPRLLTSLSIHSSRVGGLPLARFCSGRCALHAKSTFSLYASWILRSFFFGPNVHAKGPLATLRRDLLVLTDSRDALSFKCAPNVLA